MLVTPSGGLLDAIFDTTFSGIHRFDWFDYAMLIPYFAVLVVLSIYGIHRYEIIRSYWKHKKNLVKEPPVRFEELPPVTIQLPLYNERYVVERLLDQISRMEYPRHLLQIQVLDDSTDDTHPFTEALVAEYRAAGLPIEYHHRSNRHGLRPAPSRQGSKRQPARWSPSSTRTSCLPPTS